MQMKIKQDSISKLWCRNDGAVLMPPNGRVFKTFRWTFGSNDRYGYKVIGFHGKTYKVHAIVCRAFHGLAPIDKPFVDHIDRIKSDNRPENLRWASAKENQDNKDCVDQSIAKFGVRQCEDRAAYDRAHGKSYYESHREEYAARGRAYYESHREEYAARGRAYRERRKSEAA